MNWFGFADVRFVARDVFLRTLGTRNFPIVWKDDLTGEVLESFQDDPKIQGKIIIYLYTP